MKIGIVVSCGLSILPSIANAIEVPQGEAERKVWCAEYVTLLKPRKPKFMTGSPLNQEFWKKNTAASVQEKQVAEYETSLQEFRKKSQANDDRIRLCSGWGFKAN